MKAMIFAAGIGSRLKPITDSRPKALVDVGGKPLIQWQIERLQQFNIFDLVINIHHFANQIVDFLNKNQNFGSNVTFSDETDLLLDTGGGLAKAAKYFADEKYFFVQNVDIISDINYTEMIDNHINSGKIATLAVSDRKSSRMFVVNKNNVLIGWENKITNEQIYLQQPDSECVQVAFSGIHIINNEFLKFLPQKEKYSIIKTYLSDNMKDRINTYKHNALNWIDVGKPETLAKAESVIKRIYNAN